MRAKHTQRKKTGAQYRKKMVQHEKSNEKGPQLAKAYIHTLYTRCVCFSSYFVGNY